MHKLLYACAALALAPLAGGLVLGLDRKVSSWLGSHAGTSLLQPFHDALKLAGKSSGAGEPGQAFAAWMRLVCSALAVFLLFLGSDLLLAFFVFAAGEAFSSMAGVSSPSPSARIWARGELAAQFGRGSLLVLVLAGMALAGGSFKASALFGLAGPLLNKLPLIFLVLVGVLGVKLGKPPFDARPDGPVGCSGRPLALFLVAGWYDTVFLFGLCALFWASSPLGMAGIVAGVFLLLAWFGAAGARLTWKATLGHVLGWGLTLSVLNFLWLYAA